MLIEVKNLSVALPVRKGSMLIVDDLSFSLEKGRALGIVGESGSGKSVTAQALMGLLPPNATVHGELQMLGKPIAENRGRALRMIFQDPMSSLNPSFNVGFHFREALRPLKLSQNSERETSVRLLQDVGIADPVDRLSAYPHQLSGGISQRVMIALALATEPELLIADEPTTALDVTIQAQILSLLDRLRRDRGMGLILITHDFGVVNQMTDDALVLYAGYAMEYGKTKDIIQQPKHPYTRGLLRSLPGAQKLSEFRQLLPTLEGLVPNLLERPPGCQFEPRCEFRTDVCRQRVPPRSKQFDRELRCTQAESSIKESATL